MAKLKPENVKGVVLHCSDSPYARHDNPSTIDVWHRERGFTMIGYHYFINKRGDIYTCRPTDIKGAHVRGHNSNTLGICLGGRDTFGVSQMVSAKHLTNWLLRKFYISFSNIKGHYELDKGKTCPNFKMSEFRKTLND